MEIIEIIVKTMLILINGTFLISLLIDEKKESLLSNIVFICVFINTILTSVAFLAWAYIHFEPFNIYLFTLMKEKIYSFSVNFIWDINTIVFLITGNVITLLIVYFSRYYMHREEGYKRFFNTIVFFYLGYNITVLAGNFITLFIGWEFLGVSSFLLVAFYRDRYLPVRNAVKVFSVYRIGDVGLIMAMWALHQIIQDNVLFYTIRDENALHHYFSHQNMVGVIVAFCLFIASLGKSAQFPFSYWLPRAMEGPTPSSAIFYGSLSVHIGILLLIRTYAIWETQWLPRVIFIFIGIVTIFTSNISGRLQSSVKTQIAYSSIAQIGIMYIELALGLKWLVLIHFVSNAFLRTYQLLLSPSMATYLMRQKMYFSKLIHPFKNSFSILPDKLYYSLFILGHKEWNLDYYVNFYLFGILKKIGKYFNFINSRNWWIYLAPLFVTGSFFYFTKAHFYMLIEYYLPMLFALFALITVMRAFYERKDPMLVISLLLVGQMLILLAIFYNENFNWQEAVFYLSGIVSGSFICFYVLKKIKMSESGYLDLNKYYGHVHHYRWQGFVYLFGILCMIGFPITPTFIGEELILEHIHAHQFFLSFAFALHFIINGITGIKTYARLFLGPSCKQPEETAIKSA